MTTPDLIVAAGGATLNGGGTLALSNLATNLIQGAKASATLTNVDNTISGAGQLGAGQLTLSNKGSGTINGNGTVALIIDTGANTISNAGLIEATGAGGVTIQSAVNNTGVLEANGGSLTVNGAVSGGGSAVIKGAMLMFASSFSQDVSFTGATGVLELAQSQTYKKSVTGFSHTGGTSLDLLDIAFVSSKEATFVDNGSKTGGVLTVTDGVHTAKITLVGDYTAATFTASSDGHGGVSIVDPTGDGGSSRPPVSQEAARPVSSEASHRQFIEAMAGFGADSGGSLHIMPPVQYALRQMFAAPRLNFA